MAPIAIDDLPGDDFVFTLSDAEDGFPQSEEEELETQTVKSSKRKRERQEDSRERKNKKQKKAVKAVNGKNNESEEAGEKDWAEGGEDDGTLASDFEFEVGETVGIIEDFDGWEAEGHAKKADNSMNKKGVDIDEIIARRRHAANDTNGAQSSEDKGSEEDFTGFDEEDEFLHPDGFGMGAGYGGEEEQEDADSDEEEEDNEPGSDSLANVNGNEEESDEEAVASPVAHPDDLVAEEDSEEEEQEDPAEAKRKAEFFAPEDNLDGLKPPSVKMGGSFQEMSLSRPILKGLAAVGFTSPTPIQRKTIPIALLGKDVVGGAVTGSGKTAAFIIPILERLLYRPKKVPTTRVAILMPTRELAVQCFNVSQKLASYTDITFALIVGGFSLREQEARLKTRPDVIIATPGRFIDHMRNSASFAVDTLEILVLDEADRMLEDGFAAELNEIVSTIPKSRQTLLFSATMTDSVDKLIRVGLQRPARLLVDGRRQTVAELAQEFVRLRAGREAKRSAYLVHLCKTVYTSRAIVFFRQKRTAHRTRVLFSLLGLRAAELHGSMTQEQRLAAVERFRSGQADFLLATDLASRGLDIKNVETVVNFEAPQSHEIYLHRVGRTARAGRSGRSCTLAAEEDRRVVKAAVKSARAQGAKIASRTVPIEDADRWAAKIEALEEEIEEVLKEEKEERALQTAERDVKKGENLVEFESEIKSRPRRTWFESEKEKKAAKERGWAELNGDVANVGRKKDKRKLSNKEKKKLDLRDERKEGRMWKKGKGIKGIKMKGKKGSSKGKKK